MPVAPRGQVAKGVAQPQADLDQHPVANPRAQRFVQPLEAIEIDQDDRTALAGRPRQAALFSELQEARRGWPAR